MLFCEYSSLVTESDVEQKFIYPFLTAETPMGLALEDSEILTKNRLQQKIIGKGKTQKYYYPDYMIEMRGIPVLVIEAKKPGENLEIAYSEARLYAEEINASFPHNISVCQFIIVCSGTETWIGYSDHAEPILKLDFDDFAIENVKYVKLLDFCSKQKLQEIANIPYKQARGKKEFNTPVSKLGGKRVQNEELEENSFGRTFILENRTIFDPETEEERGAIVENAYITSAKREQHAEPIYKEIRKFELPSKKNTTSIATDNPTELVQKISQRIDDKIEAYSLMLLIGNVGSGKTTFVRYFRKMFLEKKYPQLAQKCDWIFLNMNFAPLTKEEIYGWVKNEIILQIKNNHQNINFSSFEIIKKIFRKDLQLFEDGIGQLLKEDKISYQKEEYQLLKEKMEDLSCYLNSLLSYLKGDYSILPIIVLDNCDKRNKDEQLLMFEVAQWLRTTFKCVVILPMRDSTYDLYRNEPPLDTVVKDLVFRIDPPDLLKVLQARLDYIVRITEQTASTYILRNGFNVSVKQTELIEYFKCIMVAIRRNSMASDIFYRLSDRNTRNGIQIFEDFCKSGHILAEDILMIRTGGKEYELPSYKFLNAMLRKNRRYYNGEESNFINLFYSDYNDDFPDPFIRIDILQWLKAHNTKEGPTKNKGMFPAGEVIRDMQLIGHSKEIIIREINYLIKRGLILSETLLSNVGKDDLIKITLSGLLHINLLHNVTYLAACAENVLFKDVSVMTSISRRLASNTYLTKLSMVLTADEMIKYLEGYRMEFSSHPEVYLLDGDRIGIYDLEDCKNAISKWLDNDSYVREEFSKIKSYPSGKSILAKVVNKGNNGLVCALGENQDIKGFLSALDTKYNLDYAIYETISKGEYLTCEIIEFDYDHRSFQLRFIDKQG